MIEEQEFAESKNAQGGDTARKITSANNQGYQREDVPSGFMDVAFSADDDLPFM